jgi:hypothetical protein
MGMRGSNVLINDSERIIKVFRNVTYGKLGKHIVLCVVFFDGKRRCRWVAIKDPIHLAMALGEMNVFECDIVREIAELAEVVTMKIVCDENYVTDFVTAYCSSKPCPGLYGMTG